MAFFLEHICTIHWSLPAYLKICNNQLPYLQIRTSSTLRHLLDFRKFNHFFGSSLSMMAVKFLNTCWLQSNSLNCQGGAFRRHWKVQTSTVVNDLVASPFTSSVDIAGLSRAQTSLLPHHITVGLGGEWVVEGTFELRVTQLSQICLSHMK